MLSRTQGLARTIRRSRPLSAPFPFQWTVLHFNCWCQCHRSITAEFSSSITAEGGGVEPLAEQLINPHEPLHRLLTFDVCLELLQLSTLARDLNMKKFLKTPTIFFYNNRAQLKTIPTGQTLSGWSWGKDTSQSSHCWQTIKSPKRGSLSGIWAKEMYLNLNLALCYAFLGATKPQLSHILSYQPVVWKCWSSHPGSILTELDVSVDDESLLRVLTT